jgi:hypothetical protein
MTACTFIECTQGSAKWLFARRGKPTGSRYGDIVTPTGLASKAAARKKLMFELLGERISGQTAPHFESEAMRRGTQLEPEARAWYSLQEGVEVRQIGFAYWLDGRAGASPDGLVGDDGCIEIKCRLLHNHLLALATDVLAPAEFMQAQGVMAACGRQWCDFVHYTDAPNVPSRVLRVQRDDGLIEAMATAIKAFCDELDDLEAAFRKRHGLGPAADVELDELSGDWCPFGGGDDE